jgi:hypothetical protein
VKFERIPDWCAICGMLGHVYKEHGDGIHAPEALVFKDIKAAPIWRSGSRTMGRAGGHGASRGRMRGRDPGHGLLAEG